MGKKKKNKDVNSKAKVGIGFIIGGNTVVSLGALIILVIYFLLFLLGYSLVDSPPSVEGDGGVAVIVFYTLVFFAGIGLGAIGFLLSFVLGWIETLVGLLLINSKSNEKWVNKTGRASLLFMVITSAVIILLIFVLLISTQIPNDTIQGWIEPISSGVVDSGHISLLRIVSLVTFLHFPIVIYSIAVALISLRMGKLKTLPLIVIISGIITAIVPIPLYLGIGLTRYTVVVLLIDISILGLLALVWSSMNTISLGRTLWRLSGRESGVNKKIETFKETCITGIRVINKEVISFVKRKQPTAIPSLAFGVLGFCFHVSLIAYFHEICFLVLILGLILGIVAIILGKKTIREIEQDEAPKEGIYISKAAVMIGSFCVLLGCLEGVIFSIIFIVSLVMGY